jgi:TM2 domain-containing membrane protein YozV
MFDAYQCPVLRRIKDPGEIEARLLELAHTTDAKITAPALAYFAPCALEDASRVLDDLAAHDRLSMEIEEDGTVVYHLLGRQKLARSTLTPLPMTPTPAALVPIARAHREASPLLAAVLSVVVPGAGHLYTGRIVAALLWFLAVSAGYALILPGLLLHLFNIVSAASSAHRLNVAGGRPLLLGAGHP